MKRKSNFKFVLFPIIIALIGSLLPNAFSAWAGGNSYNADISNNKDSDAVCYIQNNTNDPKYYFPTIESAVDAAYNKEGGQTIYVIPGTTSSPKTATIKDDITIGENDTLILPYDSAGSYKYSGDLTQLTNTFAGNSHRTLVVTVNDGVIITINGGSLIVGGIVGRNSTAGVVSTTSSTHAQLLLGNESKIVVNKERPDEAHKSIEVYGYVRKKDKDVVNALIELEYGSLMTPAVVYDMKGGTATTLLLTLHKGKKVFPFSVFDFPNIELTFELQNPAQLYGYFMINIGDIGSQEILLITDDSDTNSALFRYTQDSRIEITYTPKNYGTLSNVPLDSQHTTNIKLYGTISLSTLSLKISTYSINSADYYLPINYRLFIEAMPESIINISENIKFLSGSKFICHNGATVNIKKSIYVFKKDYDPNNTANYVYPYSTFKEGGQFIINGDCVVENNQTIYGFVDTTSEGAYLNLSSAAVDQTNNLQEFGGGSSSISFITVDSLSISGTISISDQIKTSNFLKGEYYSYNNDSLSYWKKDSVASTLISVAISSDNGSATVAEQGGTFGLTPLLDPETPTDVDYNNGESYKWEITSGDSGSAYFNNDTNLTSTNGVSVTLHLVANTTTSESTVTVKLTVTKINGTTVYCTKDFTRTPKPSGGGTTPCMLGTTEVLLSNGQTKLAKNLQKGDKVLTFNHLTGSFESRELIFNAYGEKELFDVIRLEFENGNMIELATGHGFFNVDRNTYEIYYGEEFYNHIGETFLAVNYNSGQPKLEKTKLVDVSITKEYVEKYSPLSEYDINCITDGMLTIPDDIEGMFDSFTYNEDFTYNLTALQEDIDKYGVYTYEDVKDVVHPYVFEVFNFKYWKAFIGKGTLTYDKVNHWIKTYMDQIVAFNNLDWDTSKQVPLGPQHG